MSWLDSEELDANKESTCGFAKATNAQQVALRDALVKTELAVQHAAVGSGSAADQGAAGLTGR